MKNSTRKRNTLCSIYVDIILYSKVFYVNMHAQKPQVKHKIVWVRTVEKGIGLQNFKTVTVDVYTVT